MAGGVAGMPEVAVVALLVAAAVVVTAAVVEAAIAKCARCRWSSN
jgi:hypothetical protein